MRTIPLSKAYIDAEIKQKILEITELGWYILGEQCQLFEKEFAEFIGTSEAVVTSSGTAAILLTLQALGVKAGDEVIVPAHTAFPTVEPILLLGATPIFVDIDETYTLNPTLLEEKITPHTVGIIPVHLYGHPAHLDPIQRVAEKYHLFVLEDCCQAHGAAYKGKRVGSWGKAGCFSFYPSKNMTVYGDGGMVTTSDAGLAEKIRLLRNHGLVGKYRHEILGHNLRFNEIQAAVGRLQLQKLEWFNQRRRALADFYSKCLREILEQVEKSNSSTGSDPTMNPWKGLLLPSEQDWAYAVYHLYVVRILSTGHSNQRDRLIQFLQEKGIHTGIHYPIPCHLQPVMKNFSDQPPVLPKTESVVREIISLPMFPELTEDEILYITQSIKEFLTLNP